MFKLHSVAGRIVIGGVIGLAVGMLMISLLPMFGFPLWSFFGFGTLIMFMFMGIMIGFMGQFDRHPLFDFKMKWWMTGAVIGFLFTLMYVLLGYDSLADIIQSAALSWMGLTSPFWTLVDGIIIGVTMSWAETKFAGEGSDLPLR
jgi:hypothetical protein